MVKTTISITHFKKCVEKQDVDIIYTKDDVYVAEKGSVEYGINTVSFVLCESGRVGNGYGKRK